MSENSAYWQYEKLPPFSLEPCPFCGDIPFYGNWAGGGGVLCKTCGAKIIKDHKIADGVFVFGGEIAAEAWNRRDREQTIVRCKDCQYFHKSPTLMGQERDDGWCEWIDERLAGKDHYCAWGTERSEDGTT